MKKITCLFLFLGLILASCEKNPEASFQVDNDVFQISQEITFNNTSHNADSYEWDFGDGYISNQVHPVHSYQLTGTYDVVLTAFSKKGLESKALLTLTLVEPSLLVVEVLEYYSGDPVSGASVILYASEDDWDNSRNMIIEGFTANDGVVVFANLDPIVHFVDVWEQNYDNHTLREENIENITTPQIVPNTVQWFVAYVDIRQIGKGIKGANPAIIKKLERKPVSVTKAGTMYSDSEWQELYDRSVKKK